jgi:tetratricopeptide (TPR) repeat protein
MATKTKTSETQAAAPDQSLESVLQEGLEHFNGGRLAQAAQAFETVRTGAASRDLLNMSHAARGYLRAVQERIKDQTEPIPDSLELSAQLHLNQGHGEAALVILDKALAAQPERAILLYLKSLALAQLERVQESADALTAAAALEPDFLFQFRLDADFDAVRFSTPFAALYRN